MLRWLWDLIDISENLTRSLLTVAQWRGPAASFMAWVFLLPLCIVSGLLAWTFDLRSTWDASAWVAGVLLASLPAWLTLFGRVFTLLLTLSGTLMEMGGASFARSGSKIFQGSVVALAVFDLVTDAPLCYQFVDAHPALWQWGGAEINSLMYWLVWCCWLFMASYGWELIFAVTLVCFFAALRQAARPVTSRS